LLLFDFIIDRKIAQTALVGEELAMRVVTIISSGDVSITVIVINLVAVVPARLLVGGLSIVNL